MVGLLDFFTGSGDYADPNKIDPRYGVPMSDVRQAGLNSLANVSALLLAAGQGGVDPSQRAQLLSQIGRAMGGMNTDLYNAAQRRLMTTQMQEKQAESENIRQFGELMKNPEQFKAQTGFDVKEFAGIPARDAVGLLRQIQAARMSRDPIQQQAAAMNILKTQRELETPNVKEVGGVLYEYDPTSKSWKQVGMGRPPGGLEGDAQAMILAATKDPRIAETAEYSIAFNRMFGPKMVSAFNPATQQMEYTWAAPPIPQGVIPPRALMQQQAPAPAPTGDQAAPAAAPGAPSVAPSVAAPSPGGVSPLISQRPPEEKPLTEDQARATGFAGRMIQASKIIDPLDYTAASKPGFLETVVGPKAGETVTNYMRDEDRQRYRQAQENWVRANLRKESGAVIGVDEMQKEIENYFPRPGDSPAVIEQKRKSREAATQAMITAAGPGAKRSGFEYKPYEPSMVDKINAATPQELLTMDTSRMSNEEKAAYAVRLNRLNRGR